MKIAKSLVVLGVIVIVGLAGWHFWSAHRAKQQQARSHNRDSALVLVATAVTANMPQYLDGVGTVQATNTVTIHTQVDGTLMSVAFREGQFVHKDDLLAKIDPATYQAAYDQAVAKREQDKATLENARLDLVRYINLARQKYGSQQQADTQRALVAQDAALVRYDEATIESAAVSLQRTDIKSPLDGRTGIRQVDPGNLVHATDTSGIVVITQLQPIDIVFTLPQQTLSSLGSALGGAALPVDALEPDGHDALDHGTLSVVDNQIDSTTGTFKLKASFPNADLKLWPGAFINVQLLARTLLNVVVVPAAAIQQGPDGPLVFKFDAGMATVSKQAVTVLQQDDARAVVGSGVAAGDQIVTTGFGQIEDGTHVRATHVDWSPTKPAESAVTAAPADQATSSQKHHFKHPQSADSTGSP